MRGLWVCVGLRAVKCAALLGRGWRASLLLSFSPLPPWLVRIHSRPFCQKWGRPKCPAVARRVPGCGYEDGRQASCQQANHRHMYTKHNLSRLSYYYQSALDDGRSRSAAALVSTCLLSFSFPPRGRPSKFNPHHHTPIFPTLRQTRPASHSTSQPANPISNGGSSSRSGSTATLDLLVALHRGGQGLVGGRLGAD